MITFNYSKLRGRIKEKFGNEKDFAVALGMSDTNLSLIFNNKAQFKQITIKKAVALLEIPPEEIDSYFFCVED